MDPVTDMARRRLIAAAAGHNINPVTVAA